MHNHNQANTSSLADPVLSVSGTQYAYVMSYFEGHIMIICRSSIQMRMDELTLQTQGPVPGARAPLTSTHPLQAEGRLGTESIK